MNTKNLIFIDTETTGREEQDRIFQIAYDFEEVEYNEMFKPPLPICIEAMEATGYTNKDVADKPEFAGSEMEKHLQSLLADDENIFIAHNAQFDIAMIEKEGLKVEKYIDTLKVARHLDPQAKLGAYRLQYLRYALELEVKDALAHDALGDVRVLKALFERLLSKMIKESEGDEQSAIEEMMKISQEPTFIHRIPFGKHKDKLIVNIAGEDRGYLEWLLKQKLEDSENDHDQNEDWIFTLKKVLEK